MPPQNELPEGTDHIINGAMETNPGGGTDIGSGVSGGGAASSGLASGGVADGSALVATAGGDGTGGTTGGTGGVTGQLRDQAYQLRDQGVGRVREFADGGKTRAGDALEELSRVFADTADTIDERMGREYGEYARKASDAVSNFAETLRNKEVDDIYQDVTNAVRKSPGIAIGVAAVVGFAVARVVKAGLSDGTTGTETGGGRSSAKGGTTAAANTGTGTGTTGA